MTADDIAEESEWQSLHDRIIEILDRLGKKDAFREGDYWLLDENWGWERQQLEFQNLALLEPTVIHSLRALLSDYPDWDITVRIDVPGTEEKWPGMGLLISHQEIIDDLHREYFPPQFRNFFYEGSRKPTGRK
jgi:hypothetical protein